MKYELGQLVKSHHDSSIWMITKIDHENEHYEIEDGIGTCYYSHDEIQVLFKISRIRESINA